MGTTSTRRRLAALSISVGIGLMAVGVMTSPAQADSGPIAFTGNLGCNEVTPDYDFELKTGNITGNSTWTADNGEFKDHTGGDADAPDGLTFTLSNVSLGGGGSASFDWTATIADGDDAGDDPDPFAQIDAVLVKSGNGGNKYLYDAPGASHDEGLLSPNDSISHISFCWNIDAVTTTTTEEETTTTEEETTTTTEEETTTTEAAEVLGNVVTPAAPQAQALPTTGANDLTLFMVGMGLVLMGGGAMLVRRDLLQRS